MADAIANMPTPAEGTQLIMTGGISGRRSKSNDPRTVTVMKIGRDYFYVSESPRSNPRYWIKFRRKDWSFAGDPNWSYTLYRSMTERQTVERRSMMQDAVERFFRQWGNVQKLDDAALTSIYDLLVGKNLIVPSDKAGT